MQSTRMRTFARQAILGVVVLVAVLLTVPLPALAEVVTVHGTVRDQDTGEVIQGAEVTLIQRDDGTVLAEGVTDDQGKYSFTGGFYYWLTLVVQAKGYNNTSEDFYVEGRFEPQTIKVDASMSSSVTGPDTPIPTREPTPSYLLHAVVLAFVAIASIVMYSKIKRENLLKHAVRRRIHDYVREHPGAHYRAILDDLGLSMGVLTYHLNRLEKGEYLRSRQDGMYRRFFVTGRKTDVKFFLSDIQEVIVATIRENQGISQSKIAERINVSRKVVNYHVNILDQAGLIYMEPSGREMACYVVDRGPAAA